MTAWLSFFIIIHFRSSYSESSALNLSFTIGSATSPYNHQRGMAIGHDATSNDILLLGGWSYYRLLLLFKNNHFFTGGPYFFNYSLYGYGQYYTQLEDELYVMRPNGKGFLRFNTETHESLTLDIIPPQNVSYGACLTSVTDHLIIIGGTSRYFSHYNDWGSAVYVPRTDGTLVQIYRLSDGEWLSDIPSLQNGREELACAVLNDKIYAIGGEEIEGSNSIDTIEVLDVSDLEIISSKTWYILRESLNTPREGARAVVHGAYIYVVGGYNPYFLRDVDRINTVTEECTVVGYLAAGMALTAPIIVDNVLYVFGAYLSSDSFWYQSDHFYQYASLPTLHHSDGKPDAKKTLSRNAIMTILIVAGGTVLILLIIFFYFGKREFETAALERQMTATPGVEQKNTDVGALGICEEEQAVDGVTAGVNTNVQADEFIVRSDSEHGRPCSPGSIGPPAATYSSHGARFARQVTSDALEGEGQNVDVNNYVINPDTAKEVKTWLTSIGCGIYYDSFVNKGFDSLELIKEIHNVNDLRSVGVSMKAQQLKILNHIKKL